MAKTKEQFNNNPWTTDQSFVISSLPISSGQATKLSIINLNKQNTLYLFNLNNFEEVKIELIPDNIAEEYSPKIVSVDPFGTITPINFYVGGNSKNISFNFDLYEDYYDPIEKKVSANLSKSNGSIYDLIKILQNMTKPYYANGILFDPIVYFQLGDQFVGKGHIDFSFDYNKPYRNGRYTVIKCGMSFTFHEEFEDDPINLNDTYSSETTAFSFNSNLLNDFVSIEDFVKFQYDPQYFVYQVFSNRKVSGYFTQYVISQIGTFANNPRFDSRAEYVQERNNYLNNSLNVFLSGERITKPTAIFQNTFAIDLFNLFFELSDDILTKAPFVTLQATVQNLTTLLNKASDLETTFKTNVPPIYLRITYDRSNIGGWYPSQTFFKIQVDVRVFADEAKWVQMTAAEKTAFQELLNYFNELVTKFKNIYSELLGAGS
jgi:hypothetical protein